MSQTKRKNGIEHMSIKGVKTKELIRKEAYRLFAEKGYKDVTMQEICEKTGLSRGGLYRHYGSTESIFLEIINGFSDNQKNEISSKIQKGVPATEILDNILERYRAEMADAGNSLSIAIYEYFSNPKIAAGENSVRKHYSLSKEMWVQLIQYGIRTGEFQPVIPEEVYDLIVFSYQGVRMYSRLMPMEPSTPLRIVNQIKCLLLKTEGKS